MQRAWNSRNRPAMFNFYGTRHHDILSAWSQAPWQGERLPMRIGLCVAASQEIFPMSLKEKLDATRAASTARVPADKRAIMTRASADLRASGILQKVLAVGQPAPEFSAPNHDGRMISSHDLVARAPLVISFFRGAW